VLIIRLKCGKKILKWKGKKCLNIKKICYTIYLYVFRWQLKNKYWEFISAIRKNFIDNITDEFLPNDQKQLIHSNEINTVGMNFQNSDELNEMDQFNEHNNVYKSNGVTIGMEYTDKINNDNNVISNPTANRTIKHKNKQKMMLSDEEILHKKHIWYSKVMRFVGYCLAGGLTDYSLTYEKFLTEIILKTQTSNSDILDLIYQTINLVNGKQISKDLSSNRDIIAILSAGNELKFNENILSVCIKTGYLAKSICENIGIFCKILNYILEHHCTNKILSKIIIF
jgi:hypothetical protein